MRNENRVAAVELTRKAVYELVSKIPGIPADAVIESGFEDPWTRNIIVVLRHPSFAPVPEGETIPLIGGVKYTAAHFSQALASSNPTH